MAGHRHSADWEDDVDTSRPDCNPIVAQLLLELGHFAVRHNLKETFATECAVIKPQVDAALSVQWNGMRSEVDAASRFLKAYKQAVPFVIDVGAAEEVLKSTRMTDEVLHLAQRLTTESKLGSSFLEIIMDSLVSRPCADLVVATWRF